MICFTIALRSPQSTKDWKAVLDDFNRTLHSCFNQTNSEFRVFVGCNEVPELYNKYDNRLNFITADLPIPNTWEERCRDRSWKLLMCAKAIRENFDSLFVSGGGIYVFPVDADDYVNCNIAQWCVDHPEANGFKAVNGYKWLKGSSWLEITPYFGGSMNIMKMYKEDLPEKLPDSSLCFEHDTAMKLTERYPIRWYDIEVEQKFARLGRALDRLPFKSTIYVLGTGSNISCGDPNNKSDKKSFHPVAFLRSINPVTHRYFTKKIKKEFGLINI